MSKRGTCTSALPSDTPTGGKPAREAGPDRYPPKWAAWLTAARCLGLRQPQTGWTRKGVRT